MRAALILAGAAISAPLAATPGHVSLPGVSDEETAISSGAIKDFHRGHGDVLFVSDRTDRWYRVALNEGCLEGPMQLRRVVFESSAASQRIDRFTKVAFPDDLRSCSIKSIRRSAPPPQVDADSPVTLD